MLNVYAFNKKVENTGAKTKEKQKNIKDIQKS